MENSEGMIQKRRFLPTGRSQKGEPFVWLAAAGLVLGLVMALSLFSLVAWKGMMSFWPSRIEVWHLNDGSSVVGQFVGKVKDGTQEEGTGAEIQVYLGNEESNETPFRFLKKREVHSVEQPMWMLLIERKRQGPALVEAYELRIGVRRMKPSDPDFESTLQELNELFSDGGMEEKRQEAILVGRVSDSEIAEYPAESMLHLFAPNRASPMSRLTETGRRIWRFLADEPRQANTRGGVFPAIFGTVVMTLLMSLFVTPFGVIAAIYLREYAGQGLGVRLVRICVHNLAGVPSIVFGVFGLSFFVLFVGGNIDQLFYAGSYPAPTFKTPGILWASLTLAVLTLPVVIVSTEEALSSVPTSVREAALACGASKWQTVQRVLLPASMPGILTGVILAMARGAGEVAPLMLVGVVKYAPALPINAVAPFFHPERKFMHLGFHIYDLGFQSPDSEVVKPIVFATALLLILVVVCLNLVAILLRGRLRRRYASNRF